jgi:hypothetical protein
VRCCGWLATFAEAPLPTEELCTPAVWLPAVIGCSTISVGFADGAHHAYLRSCLCGCRPQEYNGGFDKPVQGATMVLPLGPAATTSLRLAARRRDSRDDMGVPLRSLAAAPQRASDGFGSDGAARRKDYAPYNQPLRRPGMLWVSDPRCASVVDRADRRPVEYRQR